ncbi:kinase-like domain-containing protein [Rhizophagus clarus]|uniref:Kinase-like domain-containing protein n=1 Tax=Rhizophagus clarus TaxID=94130 RepID=A0A8H3L1W5_9GLOM|nr:kinase-like domain-containing protein [Rhizophagus clarus]
MFINFLIKLNSRIWKNGGVVEVALKCFNNFNEDNLNENLEEFLNEWDCHEKCLNSTRIINLYGFTKDLDTRNYMVVMGYANKENECSEYIVVDKLSEKLNETEESECLGCIVDNIKSSVFPK